MRLATANPWRPKGKEPLKVDTYNKAKCLFCSRPLGITTLPEMIVFCRFRCLELYKIRNQ